MALTSACMSIVINTLWPLELNSQAVMTLAANTLATNGGNRFQENSVPKSGRCHSAQKKPTMSAALSALRRRISSGSAYPRQPGSSPRPTNRNPKINRSMISGHLAHASGAGTGAPAARFNPSASETKTTGSSRAMRYQRQPKRTRTIRKSTALRPAQPPLTTATMSAATSTPAQGIDARGLNAEERQQPGIPGQQERQREEYPQGTLHEHGLYWIRQFPLTLSE